MRYSTNWLLECLLLQIKSPTAYHHIREAKLLYLPHPTTLKKLIAGQPCKFGMNELALKAISNMFRSKERRDRQGVLVFDEVQLTESVFYNQVTHKFEGYVDFGEILENDDNDMRVANHALVLMYRPFNDTWVQPILACATRNAANGEEIYKIVMHAIMKLEAIGAEVLSVICDGASTNKSFWKYCGVGEQNQEVTNRIVHPYSNSRFLYFNSDVPHMFKCIRNHFRNHVNVNYFDKKIDFKFYEKLYAEECKRSFGLRKCHKLTKSHMWPNCFEKMNVSLATQLLSGSVGTGLEFYRELKPELFEGSEDTEYFTKEMDTLFDILNSRIPPRGLSINSQQFEFLKKFDNMLDSVTAKNVNIRNSNDYFFASSETLVSLKVSIKSTIQIAEYLINEVGYKYVLTGKLNQDCLEKFFGLIRAAGGSEEHPTVSNFGHLFRLLSIYTPLKRKLRGNISTDEEVNVLVGFEQDFRDNAKTLKQKKLAQKDNMESLIVQKIIKISPQSSNSVSNLYENEDSVPLESKIDKNIVYYLAGYLCFKAKKILTCTVCIDSLKSENNVSQNEFSTLVRIVDYGGLCYASEDFYELVSKWEDCICKYLRNFKNVGDVLINCLGCVEPFNVRIGCSGEHREGLIKTLLPFYVNMRLHFYAKSIRRSLGKKRATKNNRKKSKM